MKDWNGGRGGRRGVIVREGARICTPCRRTVGEINGSIGGRGDTKERVRCKLLQFESSYIQRDNIAPVQAFHEGKKV